MKSLIVWLVQPGEPIPLWESGHRSWRTAQLADALAKRGHHVLWWTSSYSHLHHLQWAGLREVRDDERGYTVRFVRAPGYAINVSLRRLASHLVLAHGLWRSAAGAVGRPDVIVSSLPPVETNWVSARLARRFRRPLVTDVRDLHPDAFSGAVPPRLRPLARLAFLPYRWANRSALGRAAALVAISPDYLEWARRHGGIGGANRIETVIPFGYASRPAADDAQVAEAARLLRSAGVNDNRRLAWFIGSLGESTDLATAIRAFRSLSTQGRGHDVQLVISGVGQAEHELRRLAMGADNVVFTGWLDPAGIAAMRDLAWVGLATYRPSTLQSLPNKIAEYLSGGLPIVHSLGGHTEKLLSEHGCGVRYSAGSSNDLAVVVAGLLDDRERHARMCANASRLFAGEFELSVMLARYCDLIEYLGGSSRG